MCMLSSYPFPCSPPTPFLVQCFEDAEDVRTEVIALGTVRNHPNIIHLVDTFEDPKV